MCMCVFGISFGHYGIYCLVVLDLQLETVEIAIALIVALLIALVRLRVCFLLYWLVPGTEFRTCFASSEFSSKLVATPRTKNVSYNHNTNTYQTKFLLYYSITSKGGNTIQQNRKQIISMMHLQGCIKTHIHRVLVVYRSPSLLNITKLTKHYKWISFFVHHNSM